MNLRYGVTHRRWAVVRPQQERQQLRPCGRLVDGADMVFERLSVPSAFQQGPAQGGQRIGAAAPVFAHHVQFVREDDRLSDRPGGRGDGMPDVEAKLLRLFVCGSPCTRADGMSGGSPPWAPEGTVSVDVVFPRELECVCVGVVP